MTEEKFPTMPEVPSETGILRAFHEANEAFLRETGEGLRGIALGPKAHAMLLGAARCASKCNGTFEFAGVTVMLDWRER